MYVVSYFDTDFHPLLRCLPSLSVAAQETRRTSNDAVLEDPPMADPSLAGEEPLTGT